MDATAFNILLACIGAALLLFAFVARPLKHAATLPVVAFVVGIALGPAGLDLVTLPPGERGDGILEQLARVSLAVALIGAALRFDRGRLRALAVLLLRRPLPLWPLLGAVRGARAPRERAFLGWFGPMGVSSMFYVLLAMRHLHDRRVMAIGSLAITASVFAHGLSSGVLTRRYARAEAGAGG
ncbi:hypothetical protein [Coralloluteibacterium stylophorae]|uniref:Cation/H+ exchanger domain-containing protein n=1 Tax=Coralloluteibacterium stylophorae TaxID=1776034 RepID=A0A8J8AX62_9GAMM|nr:hypothetical protein [Coralloluteibacterium stylophorae]MBS7456971.1 hypothetical protein [Coralloluteibacterium stylophorae]